MGRPQILMLGNGINRAFNSDSWDDLLNSVDVRDEKYDIRDYKCPETLKAILVTKDNVDKALKEQKDRLGNLGTEKPAAQTQLLRRLLSIGFHSILTTNYSYELETAALGENKINESTLKRIQTHTDEVGRCESFFMLHTYNSVTYNNIPQRIFHIHGEARKPNSMILGAYYYGLLLGKILEVNKKRANAYANGNFVIKSWTDAFIIGDVYILGFGFGFSESDMWWLINRKKREPGAGHTVFYEMDPPERINRAKIDLLRLMNVEIVCLHRSDWKQTYADAVSDIEKRTKESAYADRDSTE